MMTMKEAKQYLRYGDIRAIAKAAGMTPVSIGRILHNTSRNKNIEDIISRVAQKRKQEYEMIAEKLTN